MKLPEVWRRVETANSRGKSGGKLAEEASKKVVVFGSSR